MPGQRQHFTLTQSKAAGPPKTSLALQANNLLFANCESITNTEVSVTRSPEQLLSITSREGTQCIDRHPDFSLFLAEGAARWWWDSHTHTPYTNVCQDELQIFIKYSSVRVSAEGGPRGRQLRGGSLGV